MHPSLWTKVYIDPLPLAELKEIALGLHSDIPSSVVDSALAVFQALDRSGRDDNDNDDNNDDDSGKLWIGRHPSVRDLFKVLSRISNGIPFERNVKYATESQRTLCLAETFDVFAAACPDREMRREFLQRIAAPTWGITAELAVRYIESRCPTIQIHEASTEIGRVNLSVLDSSSHAPSRSSSPSENNFAQTDYALRLMESIGVCIRENEPTLLVGETGTCTVDMPAVQCVTSVHVSIRTSH